MRNPAPLFAAVLLLVAVDLIGSGHAAGQPQLDPFVCYRVRLTAGGICDVGSPSNLGAACQSEVDCGGSDAEPETDFCVPNRFAKGVEASLANVFETKAFRVIKPIGLCNPADVEGAGIFDPLLHLQGFKIKEVRTSCVASAPVNALGSCDSEEDCGGTTDVTEHCEKTPKHVRQLELAISNDLGDVTIDTIKPDRLLVPTAKDELDPVDAPDPGSHAVDHYTCYRVKVSKGTPKFPKGVQVSAVDQFAQPALYDVKKPSRFCVATDKNEEGINDPASHLACYKVRRARKVCDVGSPQNEGASCKREEQCGGTSGVTAFCVRQDSHAPALGLHTNNQFGADRLDTRKEEEVCFLSRILDPDVDDDSDGFTENQGDCDDTNPAVFPGAAEVCNGIDDDCDGDIDEDDVCAAPNEPPEVTSAPVTSVTEGAAYSYDLEATDPNAGDVLTYSLTVAPAGMTIDPGTGLIQWSPGAGDVGQHGVVARVEDGGGLFDTDPFVLTVVAIDPNLPPALDPIADQSVKVGASLTVTATSTDPNAGDVPTFSLLQAPVGMTIDAGSGLIDWTPAGGDVGAHQVEVEVEDGGGLLDQTSFVVVAQENQAPIAVDDLYAVRADETLIVGAPGVLDNDSDPNGDSLGAQEITPPAIGTLNLAADGSFDFTPPAPVVGTLAPAVTFFAAGGGIHAPPMVIDTDLDGIAEVIYLRQVGGGRMVEAVKGDTLTGGGPVQVVFSEFYSDLSSSANLAVGNIDADLNPEIIAVGQGGTFLRAFDHTGMPEWTSDALPAGVGTFRDSGAALADLDGDGTPEIIVGHGTTPTVASKKQGVTVYDNTGTRLWTTTQTFGDNTNPPQYLAHVADIDLDGSPEIVSGGAAYTSTGVIEWTGPFTNSSDVNGIVIGNLDADPFAEVVFNVGATIQIVEHDGTLKLSIPRSSNGRTNLADFDGDGVAELGVPSGATYTVIEADGTVVWTHNGSQSMKPEEVATLFDLDGDGDLEVILRESSSGFSLSGELVILDAATGTELHRLAGGFGGAVGISPVVVDVDDDDRAEILAASTGVLATLGFGTFESTADDWAPTREIWNQGSYHVTNVEPDGTPPTDELENWLVPGVNLYWSNLRLPAERSDAFASATYEASDGSLTSDPATLGIHILPANDAPVILSSGPGLASPDFLYQYLVLAVDPDAGEVLTFSLVDGPAGMTIDPGTGLIQWTPTAGDLGTHPVTIQVIDTQLATAIQHYALQVVPSVLVPDVIGLAQAAAEAVITGGQLSVGDLTNPSSASVPVGEVLGQSPASGTEVAAGSPVDIAVSSGPAPVSVPDVVSLVQAAAENAILGADLVVGTVTAQNSDTVPKGGVIGQLPVAGTVVTSGATVDVTVSSGPAIVLTVAVDVVAGGQDIPFTAVAFDANGDPEAPQPTIDMVLSTLPGEITGTAPALLADRVTTGADTRGVLTITATRQDTAASDAVTAVVAASTAQKQLYGDLAAALIGNETDFGALEKAVAELDLPAIAALKVSLEARRDSIDLETLRRSTAYAPDGGFLPDLADVIAAGFLETPDDAAFFDVTLQIVDKLEAIEGLLDAQNPASPFDDDQSFAQLNTDLEALVSQLEGLNPTVHGTVKSAGRMNHLISVRVPALIHAEVNRTVQILQDEGLASVAPDLRRFYAKAALGPSAPVDFYRESRPTFFTVAGMMVANKIRSTIITRAYKPYLIEIAKSSLILTTAGLLEVLFAPTALDAVITAASLSLNQFHVAPSAIEGLGFGTNFPEENDVYLIGPNAVDAALGVIDTIDPGNVTNLDELQEKFEEVKAAAEGAVDAFEEANSMPESVLAGCLFNSNPACNQLVYPGGFDSVYKMGSFPAPVLVVVRDVTTGRWGILVVAFFPHP